MIIPMLCVTIFVILVVWFLLPRVARLMIHTPTAISIFVCLSMVQLMAVFISMRCTFCHADYFDFERIEALKPAIEACGISTLSQSPMLGFHKQMDNRIKLLEEILSF